MQANLDVVRCVSPGGDGGMGEELLRRGVTLRLGDLRGARALLLPGRAGRVGEMHRAQAVDEAVRMAAQLTRVVCKSKNANDNQNKSNSINMNDDEDDADDNEDNNANINDYGYNSKVKDNEVIQNNSSNSNNVSNNDSCSNSGSCGMNSGCASSSGGEEGGGGRERVSGLGRKERNRLAAAKSNMKRKRQTHELRLTLVILRQKVVMLRERENMLRVERAQLGLRVMTEVGEVGVGNENGGRMMGMSGAVAGCSGTVEGRSGQVGA